MPAHMDVHQASSEGVARHHLLYGLNDKPPLSDSIFVAMQHVCAIFIPIVTPGLLVCGTLKLDLTTSYILGMSLFVSGIATLIQAKTFGSVGSGLLSIQGTSLAFVTPMVAVATTSLEQGRTPEQALAVILGLSFFGIVDFSCLNGLPIVNFPIPFRFGLAFDLATFISFAVIYIALTLEVVGDIMATSMVTDEPITGNVFFRRLKGGILGDGVNSLLAAV